MITYRIDPDASVITVYAEIEGAIIARPKMALDTGAKNLTFFRKTKLLRRLYLMRQRG